MKGRALVSLLLLAASSGASAAQEPLARAASLFEMHSGFWLNLHHFLYVQARARTGQYATRPTVTSSLADTAGLSTLTTAERGAWDAALAYYTEHFAERNLTFDSAAVVLKDELARLAHAPRLAGSGLDTALVRHLDQAAPVYRARWWPSHDASNRAWVASMIPLLERHGAAIARGVTRAAGTSWPTQPIRVDVSAYTNWAGAYATAGPSHVMISSTAADYRGTLGLEMLFHEAMHTFQDSLDAARRRSRLSNGEQVPPPLVHAIIFFTAGEITRRAVPGHTPYIDATGLARRGSMSRYFPLLRQHWMDRIDGARSLDDAIRRIAGAL